MPGGQGRGRGGGGGRRHRHGRSGGGGRQGRGGVGHRRLLEPVLLLELCRGPAHGYSLLDGLAAFDLGPFDPSVVYRVLRDLDLDGCVTSTWDERATQGPPRRVYEITDRGREALDSWATELARQKARIDTFLAQYRKQVKR